MSTEEQLQQENERLKEELNFQQVKKVAEDYLGSKNVILPEDPAIARNHIEKLLHKPLSENKYKIEGGNIKILDSEGYSLTNEFGHEIEFNKHLDKIIDSTFEISLTKGSGKKHSKLYPKTANEYAAYLTDKNIPIEVREDLKQRKIKGELKFIESK